MSQKEVKNIFIEGGIEPALIAKSIAKHNSKHNIGAHSIFLGQVRADEIDGKKVTAINYSAYEELALNQMDQIRQEIFNKHPLTCLHVYHSLGNVATGEICLFVFTSSIRRKPAIAACAAIVERIKLELPIWGKEIFENETHQWKENS
ncbi:Molybdopterin synthase catalytic subunit [compost metagenome]